MVCIAEAERFVYNGLGMRYPLCYISRGALGFDPDSCAPSWYCFSSSLNAPFRAAAAVAARISLSTSVCMCMLFDIYTSLRNMLQYRGER